MVKLLNRAGTVVTSTGTGTMTLGAAIPSNTPLNPGSWQTFSQAGTVTGTVVRYLILDANGNWEYGLGTYTD